jgi:serine/threonine protein kinase
MAEANYTGQVLDGKYQIDRELGRGGMGTVYLATHLGTERPVAIKIIAPAYMRRPEFVERFRREARAAGRLRHPNVVDVTDFGFAETADGEVAYLVMEYLDGCTLGEILDEENNLPVGWTLDIIEQVCSAVGEAHQQGIIHRDLKPDNIWLEPNQRGGYTVKVLDFGIAKLEEHSPSDPNGEIPQQYRRSSHTVFAGRNITLGDQERDSTAIMEPGSTFAHDAPTVSETSGNAEPDPDPLEAGVSASPSERETAILADSGSEKVAGPERSLQINNESGASAEAGASSNHSLLDGRSSAELTRVGAVLGTPLYMSPEQCRGEKLDARSDIYSLGVIAYQMLSGSTPFEGDYKWVMHAHQFEKPKPLASKRVRRKMRQVIHAALEKDPELRPESAEAFASELRSRSEGLWGLLRRSLVIYSEHLPKFILLTAFFQLPSILITIFTLTVSFLKIGGTVSETTSNLALGSAGFALAAVSMLCTYLNFGTITWIVTQYLAIPLRPVRLRPALRETQRRWKALFGTGLLSTLLTLVIGLVTCGLGFLVLSVLWALVASVVMMERISGWAAIKRSQELVRRSLVTSSAVVLILFLLPAIGAGTISSVVNLAARAIDPSNAAPIVSVNRSNGDAAADKNSKIDNDNSVFNINLGPQRTIKVAGGSDFREQVKTTVLESLIQLLWMPLQILVLSFSAIIVALLYVKTRLAGGETMNGLMERFEDDGRPRKKWQERVRQRLIQSGRVSGRSSGSD